MSKEHQDLKKRVVVTGIGVVSSIGNGRELFWKNLVDGKSGIGPIKTFDPKGMATSYGGEVNNFDPKNHISKDNVSKFGRASQLGAAASKMAVEDAGLKSKDLTDENVTIIIGTTMGESQVLEGIDQKWLSYGEEHVAPEEIFKYPGNIISINIAKELGVDANCVVIPTACAAGNYAIGYGYDQIRSGRADVAIVGGCDAFSRIALTGFSRMYAVAPEKCQPFDVGRKGILVGEGAGILVLESMEHAINRRANIYAEITGYALSCDASHMTIPNEDSITLLIQKTLTSAGIEPKDVDYISAHGTGTKQNDKTESQAINRVFGSSLSKVPVSSIKSMLGHTMGAASALEAVACVMSIYESKIPPTINLLEVDAECPIDCVQNEARDLRVNIALNNSFAFGGNNACVVFKKHK